MIVFEKCSIKKSRCMTAANVSDHSACHVFYYYAIRMPKQHSRSLTITVIIMLPSFKLVVIILILNQPDGDNPGKVCL